MLKEKIKNTIAPFLLEHGLKVVELNVKSATIVKVTITVEKINNQGINIDECAHINKLVGEALDQENTIKNSYNLEVSSAGIFRPLIEKEDFHRFINHPVKVKLKKPLDEGKTLYGILQIADDKGFTLLSNKGNKEITISYDTISKVRLNPKLAF